MFEGNNIKDHGQLFFGGGQKTWMEGEPHKVVSCFLEM